MTSAAMASPDTVPAGAPGKPNILLIVIDDLNDWVGALGGHPLVRTPRIDRLAAAGVNFTNAHVQAPLCNPSRTSFLTGLRPSTTGVYALDAWIRNSDRFRDHPTLIQSLIRNGYKTMITGKIFHDMYPKETRDIAGVEVEIDGYRGAFGPLPEKPLVQGGAFPLIDWGVFPERDEQQDDYRVVQWAKEQLKAESDRPFFLGVGFRHPHLPFFATRRWFDLYPDNDTVLPPIKYNDREDIPDFAWYLHWKLPEPRLPWLEQNHQLANKVRSYLASISFVDDLVGQVLDALEASGKADNTIVVLLSDHGYHLGEKLITGKNSLWERSTHVPLIIAGPGVKAGGVSDQPVEALDIYPTLMAMAGVDGPDNLEGHSLVPLLKNPDGVRDFPAITTQGPGNHSVRDRRYRYIRYADGSEELYDLASDPNEWRNLAADREHDAIRRRLAAFLPTDDAPPMPGALQRLLNRKGDRVYWEGESVAPAAPVPGFNFSGSPAGPGHPHLRLHVNSPVRAGVHP